MNETSAIKTEFSCKYPKHFEWTDILSQNMYVLGMWIYSCAMKFEHIHNMHEFISVAKGYYSSMNYFEFQQHYI